MEEQLQLVRGVSPLEVQRFETLFKLFDEDGSGTISVKELADLMPRLGVFHTEEELQELFHATDQDGSGDVDFSEFLNLMASQREENQLNLLVNGRASISRLKVSLKLTRNRIAPDGVVWSIWELILLMCILFYGVAITLEWILWDSKFSAESRVIPGCVFVMDVFLRMSIVALITGDNNDRLIQEQPALMKKYLKSKAFRYDLLAALPFDLIFINIFNARMILQAFRLAKLFRVGDMFPIHGKELLTPAYAYMRFQVFPMARLMFWAVLTVHVLTCVWLGLKPDSSDYIDGLYFVMYTLTSTGYGDINVHTAPQKLYCVFLFCVATIVTGLIVGKLVKLSEQADLRSDTQTKMLETLAVMRHMCIPEDFAQEILAQQYHRLQNSFSIYSATIDNLPQAMRDRMLLYARMKVVCHVPMFSGSQEICLAKLAQALVSVVVPPDEYVIIAGEEGIEMYFLFHGTCDVIGETGMWLAFIKRGGVFGEIALLSATRRAASVKSLTYCQLFRLDKASFDEISYQFPELRERVASVAQSRTKKRKASTATSHAAAPENMNLRRSSRTAAKIAHSARLQKRDSKAKLESELSIKVPNEVQGDNDDDSGEEMKAPNSYTSIQNETVRPSSANIYGRHAQYRPTIGETNSDDSDSSSRQSQYLPRQSLPRTSEAFTPSDINDTDLFSKQSINRRITRGSFKSNRSMQRFQEPPAPALPTEDVIVFDKKILSSIDEMMASIRTLSIRFGKVEHAVEELSKRKAAGREDTILTKTVLVRNKASTRNLLSGDISMSPPLTPALRQEEGSNSPRGAETKPASPRGLRSSASSALLER